MALLGQRVELQPIDIEGEGKIGIEIIFPVLTEAPVRITNANPCLNPVAIAVRLKAPADNGGIADQRPGRGPLGQVLEALDIVHMLYQILPVFRVRNGRQIHADEILPVQGAGAVGQVAKAAFRKHKAQLIEPVLDRADPDQGRVALALHQVLRCQPYASNAAAADDLVPTHNVPMGQALMVIDLLEVLAALGRTVNVDALGLEAREVPCGIQVDARAQRFRR